MRLHEVVNRGCWFRRASWGRDTPPVTPLSQEDVLAAVTPLSEEDVLADDWEFVDLSEPRAVPDDRRRRLEDRIGLTCCGAPCKLLGNLALRGAAGSPVTRLGYECTRCWRRLQVVDAWDPPSVAQLAIYDETP